MTYPKLLKSYKRRYPFRLGTTSFIYPEDYLPNVRLLAPYVDEIELLFFEADNLPAKSAVDSLAETAARHDITYNIHLPLDLKPGHPSMDIREKTVKLCHQIFQLTRPLNPTTFTLHLPTEPTCQNLSDWLNNLSATLGQILESGIKSRRISVETLDYPLKQIQPLLLDFDLSVCPDIGHLTRDGQDVSHFLETFKDRISIVHLYGGADGHAHLPLRYLNPDMLRKVAVFLKDFSGTVSMELFSFEHLSESLTVFERAISESL